jgi:dolichyl-phosphate-mannose-protein mannosyltransferase
MNTKSSLRKNLYLLLILTILSSATRFAFYGMPTSIIFDEVYFGQYATDYMTHSYYFDPHPPLGKLLLAGMGAIGGVKEDKTNYGAIGNDFDTEPRLWYRLIPALTGALLPLVIFGLLLALNFSSATAFTGGLLIVFENSLLVQSRFASLDGMLLLFGFLSLFFYVLYRRSTIFEGKKPTHYAQWNYHILSALFVSLAFSIKWTGLAYPLVIFILEGLEYTKRFHSTITWPKIKVFVKSCVHFTIPFAVIGLLIYMAIFAIHFKYLVYSGQGNDFMTPRFQKTLLGNEYTNDPSIKPKGYFGKIIETNHEMYAVNSWMNAKHDYSSKWYTWPFMIRGVFYWQGKHPDEPAAFGNEYLYFLGNPLLYWLGTLSILGLCFGFLFKKSRGKIAQFILLGFCANFVPYAFIGRVMFLYHYQAALVFSILAICYFIETLGVGNKKYLYIYPLLVVVIVLFIYFSPLTYGLHLSADELHARMWLRSWR